jgi:hypothetical protein
VPRTASYFIPSAMTGFIVSVFPFRNRVSSTEAFEGLELGEGKPSRPVLRGPGGLKAAWLLGSYRFVFLISTDKRASSERSIAGDKPTCTRTYQDLGN